MGNQALVVTRGDIFNGMDGGGGVRWVQGLYHRGEGVLDVGDREAE